MVPAFVAHHQTHFAVKRLAAHEVQFAARLDQQRVETLVEEAVSFQSAVDR